MSIKSIRNVWFSSVLLCGSIIAAPQIQDQYFCNLPALNALEQKKLEAFLDGFDNNSSRTLCQSEQEVAMRLQNLVARLISQYPKYVDIVGAFENRTINTNSDDLEDIKNILLVFSGRVQQDPEFTNLVKNLVGFGCKQFGLLIETVVLSSNYDKIKCGNVSDAELNAMIAGYIPKNIDVVQVTIEYAIVSHGYLKKQFDAKKCLTIDDLCYVLKEMGIAYKLPKQGLGVWNEFIVALQHGLKDLPQDVRNEIMKPIEDIICKPELEIGVRLVASMAKMRREIIAAKGADQGKLIGYGKLMDQVIAQIYKASAQKVTNKSIANKGQATRAVMVLEKLIFKN